MLSMTQLAWPRKQAHRMRRAWAEVREAVLRASRRLPATLGRCRAQLLVLRRGSTELGGVLPGPRHPQAVPASCMPPGRVLDVS